MAGSCASKNSPASKGSPRSPSPVSRPRRRLNSVPRAARRRPLVWVATAFLLGVAGQGLLPAWAWWALTTVALLLTARKGTFLKADPFSSGAVLVMIAGLGALTAAADQRVPPHHVAWRGGPGAAPAGVPGGRGDRPHPAGP